MQDYNLKIATPEDDFIDLLLMAIEESPYINFPYTRESLYETMRFFTSDQTKRIVILLEVEGFPVGLIAGSIAPNLLCPDMMVATEALWYVAPSFRKGRAGLKLLEAFEYWGKLVGADTTILANFGNATLDKLYEKRGYKKVEHSFIKQIDRS